MTKRTSASTARNNCSTGAKFLYVVSFIIVLLIAVIALWIDTGQGMGYYVGSLIALPFLLIASGMIICDVFRDLSKAIKNKQQIQKTQNTKTIRSLPSVEQDADNQDDHERQAGNHSYRSRKTEHSRPEHFNGSHSRLDAVLAVVYSILLIGASVFLSYPSVTAALDLPTVMTGNYKTMIIESPVVERHSIRGHIYYTMEDKNHNGSESFRINRQTYDKLKTTSDRTVIVKYLPLSHKTMDVEVY